MMLDKVKIIKELQERDTMTAANIEELYQAAFSDIVDYTHRTEEEVNEIISDSLIKDLIAYRYNTLGLEGVTSENNSGISASYDDDIPKRIKRKLQSYRVLNYER